MSNEKDGQGPDDELSISGVFVLTEEKDPAPHEISRQRNLIIDRQLILQQICGRRADVRNQFRTWVERSPRLSKLFGLPPIPAMTAQQIFDEESVLHERILRRLAREEKNIHPVRTLAHASKGPGIYVDEETLRREEKAKYTASQMKRYIDVKRFADARNIDSKAKKNVKTPNEEAYLGTVTGYVAVDGVRQCLEEQDAGHIVEAIFELGAVTNFKPEDFNDLSPDVLNNPTISEAILKKLGEFAEQHPKYYAKVRDYFVSIGLMDAETADRSKHVMEGLKKLLDRAMYEHPTAFVKFRDMIDEMGILSKEEANALPNIQAKAHSLLAYNMAESPDLYIFLRDKLARQGIVDAAACNKDPDIRKRFLGHLLCWKDVHVSVFGKFRFHWAKNDLIEPTAKELGISEVDARALVFERGGTFNQLTFEGYDSQAVGNAACHAFENELARAEKLLNSVPYIERRSLEKVVENAIYRSQRFFEDHPQVGDPQCAVKEFALRQ